MKVYPGVMVDEIGFARGGFELISVREKFYSKMFHAKTHKGKAAKNLQLTIFALP
jgi:hypothetical protein